MADYHVVRDGDSTGPFDRETLGHMAAAGALSAESYVWTDGMEDWTRAGDVPELAGLFAGQPPTEPAPSAAPSAAPNATPKAAPSTAPALASRADGRLPVFEALGVALTALFRHPWQALAVCFIYGLVPTVVMVPLSFVLVLPYGVGADPGAGSTISIFIFVLVILVVTGIMFGGVAAFMTDLVRGAPTSVSRVFAGFRRPVALPVYFVLAVLAIVIGFLLFVIPGIFLAVCFMLTPYILMDSNLSPTAALGASFRAVFGLGWWRNFAVALILFIITLMFLIAMMMVFGLIFGAIGLGGMPTMDPETFDGSGALGLITYPLQLLISLPLTALYFATYAAIHEYARANETRRQGQG